MKRRSKVTSTARYTVDAAAKALELLKIGRASCRERV
jgi:hypothetical protein